MNSDDFFTLDLDFDEVSFRDAADHQIDPPRIKADGVQFRISAESIKQMLQVAEHYAAMRELAAEIDVMRGAPIIGDDGELLGYADGIPCYRFTTLPCFTNVESIEIDGKPAGFYPNATTAVIWSEGHGITFICEGDNGVELVYGGGVHDFELFLKEAADERASPSVPA
jgi:hypothetical protein